jgi:hypothetical protein
LRPIGLMVISATATPHGMVVLWQLSEPLP